PLPPLVSLHLASPTASPSTADWWASPANLWWPWTILGALIVMVAGLYGVRTSAALGTILGIFEIGVFLVLAVLLLIHAGSNNTLSVFGTGHTPSGYHGLTGVFAGSVYSI